MDQNSKGKIFFFGPGSSLKFDFPIRTNKTNAKDSDSNESEDVNNKKDVENVKKENSSDEDSNELLKKIDAALEGENGEHENDSSKLDENASKNSKETLNDVEKSKSAFETISQLESESSSTNNEENNEDSNKIIKCESVNLSSEECSNGRKVVEKLVETEKVAASVSCSKELAVEIIEKPNEIESSSSNVDKLCQQHSPEEPTLNQSLVAYDETPPPSLPATPPEDDQIDHHIMASEVALSLMNDKLKDSVIVNDDYDDEDDEDEKTPSTSKDYEHECNETEIKADKKYQKIDDDEEKENLTKEIDDKSELKDESESSSSENLQINETVEIIDDTKSIPAKSDEGESEIEIQDDQKSPANVPSEIKEDQSEVVEKVPEELEKVEKISEPSEETEKVSEEPEEIDEISNDSEEYNEISEQSEESKKIKEVSKEPEENDEFSEPQEQTSEITEKIEEEPEPTEEIREILEQPEEIEKLSEVIEDDQEEPEDSEIVPSKTSQETPEEPPKSSEEVPEKICDEPAEEINEISEPIETSKAAKEEPSEILNETLKKSSEISENVQEDSESEIENVASPKNATSEQLPVQEAAEISEFPKETEKIADKESENIAEITNTLSHQEKPTEILQLTAAATSVEPQNILEQADSSDEPEQSQILVNEPVEAKITEEKQITSEEKLDEVQQVANDEKLQVASEEDLDDLEEISSDEDSLQIECEKPETPVEISANDQEADKQNEPLTEILETSPTKDSPTIDESISEPSQQIDSPTINEPQEPHEHEIEKLSTEIVKHQDESSSDDNQCKDQMSTENEIDSKEQISEPEQQDNIEKESEEIKSVESEDSCEMQEQKAAIETQESEKEICEDEVTANEKEHSVQIEQQASTAAESQIELNLAIEQTPATAEIQTENISNDAAESKAEVCNEVAESVAEDVSEEISEESKEVEVAAAEEQPEEIIEKAAAASQQEICKDEQEKAATIEAPVNESIAISQEVEEPQVEQPIEEVPKEKSPELIVEQQPAAVVAIEEQELSDIESDDDHYEEDASEVLMSPERDESEPRDETLSPVAAETIKEPEAIDDESPQESDSENVLSSIPTESNVIEEIKTEIVAEQVLPSINDESVDLRTQKVSAEKEEEKEEKCGLKMSEPPVETIEEKPISEALLAASDSIEQKVEQQPAVEIKNELPQAEELSAAKPEFQKPQVTRKRKLSERKSISESDSDGGSNLITDSAISNDNHSEEEEVVVSKKPRIRNKVVATRNTRATRQSMKAAAEETKATPEKSEEIKSEEKTLQNFKFDYDENEDIAANVAAIKTLICKDQPKEESEKSSDEDSVKRKTSKRKSKRGRVAKKNDAQASSSEDEGDAAKVTPDSKRTKKSESEEPNDKQKKKRESGGKGLLKHIDTSLVIQTVENEAPVRQSRRIAQQKIKEENDRRLMEEKLLKQMKADAEKKKKGGVSFPEPEDDNDNDNDRSSDESYKGSKRKKKKSEIKPADKQWQTSSSHSEHSETEDEFEHPRSEDPGSPLFRSDHEFSPESDVDDATAPPQPVKRARTAKKQVEESSDDEDVNPNHACQVCHKTDSPEWILLCDECDHGYHCSCLKPIIFCIPSGNWYCPLCCHKKLIDNLSTQLEKLDALVHEIQAEEVRKQKQLEIKKLTEITEENILKERRKNRPEGNRKRQQSREDDSSNQESESNDDDDGSSSDNSSDNAPLIYKLRRRNQTTASYRFNEYDDLINSAIREEMDEVKGMGNAGRGKDISTIIEADKEEKKMQKLEKERAAAGDEEGEEGDEQNKDEEGGGGGAESSGSEVIRRPKKSKKKKKNRKLNNLEDTSEEDKASDEDFRESSSSGSEEDYSMSSVSESSLDLPLKKSSKLAKRSTRSAAKNRRYDENFIDDKSSDDEPLIKKRTKKVDSDEESFDGNDDEDEGSTADEIDSDDLCDDTDTDSSSEGNWPKKKKKRVASYDVKKPRKPAKKDDDSDKAFRAGISKKKILKKSENESEDSDDEQSKGKRKTRGKKLLYLIEDDYESDDGIKPGIGVVRPETPPEEREMFVKKQEEIKRMLAAKNTEGARQLAVPTIEPIKLSLQQPKSPSPPPANEASSSLSTIPKNVIEGAKALDMDYNRFKPLQFGIHPKSEGGSSGSNMPAQDMSEEELARMMEEEDFAQHQLKLAGEAIARSNKLLELEGKEEAFSQFSKQGKIKDEKQPAAATTAPQDPKKRARKPKTEKLQIEQIAAAAKPIEQQQTPPMNLPQQPPHIQRPQIPSEPLLKQQLPMPSIPPLIPNTAHPSPFANLPPRYVNPNQPLPPHIQDRPSVLSNFLPRHEGLIRHELIPPQHQPPQHMRFLPQQLQAPIPPEAFAHKTPPMPHLQQQQPPAAASLQGPPPTEEVEEKKKGRRKKFTPLRTDLPESKVAKLDTPTSSVIQHSTLSLTASDRAAVDDKSKGMTPQQRAKTITAIANAPAPFGSPITNPTPSVITRLLQPQQRGPFGGGFVEQMATSDSPSQQPPVPTSRAFPDDPKHMPASKQARPSNPAAALGQPPFNEFVPRAMHPLYRGPPTSQPSIYGLPHARIPYPFHHLHPNSNLRPNMQEYAAPYNIPAQFGYYAPPAHGRHPQNPAAPHGHPHPSSHPDNSRNPNDEAPNENSSTSEFGGLVSYFSSQQELD